MYTIIETPIFEKYAATVWSDDEREAFKLWIAQNPESGDVIPQSAGLRKVRWATDGKGKRGGARVIYFNRLENGVIVLLIVYTKTKFDNLPLNFLKQLKEAAEHGQ
jgi:mRNA-degrading endonuclease RelE of RelBE toxin-antitoxin system